MKQPIHVKKRTPNPQSADKLLADHLKQAEEHLIAAVQLFVDHQNLKRRTGYLPRLIRVQETLTSLYGEELVRIRGPHKPK